MADHCIGFKRATAAARCEKGQYMWDLLLLHQFLSMIKSVMKLRFQMSCTDIMAPLIHAN